MHDARELDRMFEWGARAGQVEHRALELGLRDIDEPTSDPDWWQKHGVCEACAKDAAALRAAGGVR